MDDEKRVNSFLFLMSIDAMLFVLTEKKISWKFPRGENKTSLQVKYCPTRFLDVRKRWGDSFENEEVHSKVSNHSFFFLPC